MCRILGLGQWTEDLGPWTADHWFPKAQKTRSRKPWAFPTPGTTRCCLAWGPSATILLGNEEHATPSAIAKRSDHKCLQVVGHEHGDDPPGFGLRRPKLAKAKAARENQTPALLGTIPAQPWTTSSQACGSTRLLGQLALHHHECGTPWRQQSIHHENKLQRLSHRTRRPKQPQDHAALRKAQFSNCGLWTVDQELLPAAPQAQVLYRAWNWAPSASTHLFALEIPVGLPHRTLLSVLVPGWPTSDPAAPFQACAPLWTSQASWQCNAFASTKRMPFLLWALDLAALRSVSVTRSSLSEPWRSAWQRTLQPPWDLGPSCTSVWILAAARTFLGPWQWLGTLGLWTLDLVAAIKRRNSHGNTAVGQLKQVFRGDINITSSIHDLDLWT